GADGMRFETIMVFCREELLLYEQIAIDALMPRYNLTPIASNTLGLKWSKESRALKAEQMRGTKQSEETKRKRADALRGQKRTEDTKALLSAKQRERFANPEERRKI